jgi:TonB family protein
MPRVPVVAVALALSLPLAAQDDKAPANDIITNPSIIRKVEPKYTERTRKAGIEGTVKLKLIIAADGHPKDIEVVQSLDPELDINAIAAVADWVWKPSTKNGEPVAIKTNVEVAFHLMKKIEDGVIQPSIIRKVEPWYSKKAEKNKIEGTVKLRTVISTDGHATKIEIVESLDPELDANAIAALKQWVFKPATKNGEAVATYATIELTFHLLHR